ncbi:hypothetical protein QQF64_015513 [Cirrhinus molitorella]|uniref:Uncharacterized protein n=1 Tax=Cirrhinus molitorella TaxID=172907 RepID=A0ABR3NW57_9TELE
MSSLLSADRKHIQSVPIYSPLALQYGSQLVHSCSALPQLMERGEIEESRQARQGKRERKTQGKNILYKSSTVDVRSADADQPMRVSICNCIMHLLLFHPYPSELHEQEHYDSKQTHQQLLTSR